MKMIYSVVKYDKVLLAFSDKSNAEQYAEQQNAKVQPTLFVDFLQLANCRRSIRREGKKRGSKCLIVKPMSAYERNWHAEASPNQRT